MVSRHCLVYGIWHSRSECTLTTHVNCNAKCPHTTAMQGAHTPLQHKVPTHYCNTRCPHTTATQGAHTPMQCKVPTHQCNARYPHTTATQGAHTPLQCKVPSFAVQDTTHTDTTHCCNTGTTSPYVCMDQNTSIRATVPSLASCSTPAPCIPP